MKTLKKLLFAAVLALSTFSSWASPVNVNTASAKEISDALNGIGLKKAEAIIKYREEKGPFKTPEDLLNVSGIGEKTLEQIKADILLVGAPKAAPTAKKSK